MKKPVENFPPETIARLEQRLAEVDILRRLLQGDEVDRGRGIHKKARTANSRDRVKRRSVSSSGGCWTSPTVMSVG
jgi:hypothetical protein